MAKGKGVRPQRGIGFGVTDKISGAERYKFRKITFGKEGKY